MSRFVTSLSTKCTAAVDAATAAVAGCFNNDNNSDDDNVEVEDNTNSGKDNNGVDNNEKTNNNNGIASDDGKNSNFVRLLQELALLRQKLCAGSEAFNLVEVTLRNLVEGTLRDMLYSAPFEAACTIFHEESITNPIPNECTILEQTKRVVMATERCVANHEIDDFDATKYVRCMIRVNAGFL